MKKLIRYIVMFLTGILIGSFIFDSYGNNNNTRPEITNYVAMNSPPEERPTDLKQPATNMVGKKLGVSGIIKEAYKNKRNEVVIYLQDLKMPLMLNCTLFNSDLQIKYPIRLGEKIGIEGKLTEIDDEMHLQHCKIVYRTK
jgi:hypothetical protein